MCSLFTAEEALLLWNTVCPIMLECPAIRMSPVNFSTFAVGLYLLPLFCIILFKYERWWDVKFPKLIIFKKDREVDISKESMYLLQNA